MVIIIGLHERMSGQVY